MGTVVTPNTLCKLCCNIFEPESLYWIFETSIVIADGQDPEPILPIITNLFSVKVEQHDVIQSICPDCINTITQWKIYLDRCFQVQLGLPEELRLKRIDKDSDSKVDAELQTDLISTTGSSTPALPIALKTDAEVQTDEKSVSLPNLPEGTKVKETRSVPDIKKAKPGPLSSKSGKVEPEALSSRSSKPGPLSRKSGKVGDIETLAEPKKAEPEAPSSRSSKPGPLSSKSVKAEEIETQADVNAEPEPLSTKSRRAVTQVTTTQKAAGPAPLSVKSKEALQNYMIKEGATLEKPEGMFCRDDLELKNCRIVLERVETQIEEVDLKLVKEEVKSPSAVKVEPEEEIAKALPVLIKKVGRPKKMLTPLCEMRESPEPKQEEPIPVRSKRTPKPKQIFDPSITKNRRHFTSQFVESKSPPKKKAKISDSDTTAVVNLSEGDLEEEEDSGEYTVQINMEDEDNANEGEGKGETSYIFVATEDGGMELIPSELGVVEDTGIIAVAQNGGFEESLDDDDEEYEESPPKKIVKRKSVATDGPVRAAKTADSWIGFEFTMEFMESAIGRDLEEKEIENLASQIRRRRFREAWVSVFIGSVKGLPSLKRRICETCNEAINGNVKDYERHVKQEHGLPAVFACEYCEQEVEGSDEYYDHWEDHLQHYACRGCKLYFTSRSERDSHKTSDDHMMRQKRSGRSAIQSREKRKTTERVIPRAPKQAEPKKVSKMEGMQEECPICGIEFSCRSDLRAHTADEHSEKKSRQINTSVNLSEVVNDLSKEVTLLRTPVGDNESDEDDGSSLRSCTLCELQFENLRKLSAHLCEVHGRARGPLICEFCEISFETEIESKKHRSRKHYCQGDFCKLCKKWISSKKALEQHMKRHLGVENKTFSCFQCSKTFWREESLKAHEDFAHSSQARFECALCSLRFSRRKECLAHIGEHGDFDNHAQFVQVVQVLELEEEDESQEEMEAYFGEESILLEDSMTF